MNGTSDIQDQLSYLKQKIQIFQNKASSFQRVVQVLTFMKHMCEQIIQITFRT